MKLFIFLLVLFSIRIFLVSNQRCVKWTGRIICFKDRAARIPVMLYNANLVQDELMAQTYTNENGSFELYGCGSDYNYFFGSNDPDPYLHYVHSCDSFFKTKVSSKIYYRFEPEVFHYGSDPLDPDNRPPASNSFTEFIPK